MPCPPASSTSTTETTSSFWPTARPGTRWRPLSASAAIKGSADGVTVQGLVIEMFDNPAGAGAIHLYGSGSRILDNEIRQNGGIGVCTGGRGSQVVRNHVHHNGQMGMCGNGDNMLIANNEIDHNNTQGHRYGWEAGGSKWTNTVGLIVRNNYSHHNYGLGSVDRSEQHRDYIREQCGH